MAKCLVLIKTYTNMSKLYTGMLYVS